MIDPIVGGYVGIGVAARRRVVGGYLGIAKKANVLYTIHIRQLHQPAWPPARTAQTETQKADGSLAEPGASECERAAGRACAPAACDQASRVGRAARAGVRRVPAWCRSRQQLVASISILPAVAERVIGVGHHGVLQ